MSQELLPFLKSLFTSIKTHLSIKAFIAAFGSLVAVLIGVEFVKSMGALFILCILDFLAAMIQAHFKKRKVTSTKLPKKALDFIVYFTLTVVMKLLAETSISGIFGNYLVEAIIIWFAVGEVISLLEHANEMGYKIPISIFKLLDKKRDNLSNNVIVN